MNSVFPDSLPAGSLHVWQDPASVAFWLGALWLLYVYTGYPLCMALLGLVRRVNPEMREDVLPTVSVLISAYNEEKDISWKVEETLAWDYPANRLEVLVASDASSDRTDLILAGIKDPRFRWVRMEKRGGKNLALNRLAQMARNDVLFFTDANCHIGAACLRRMVRHFADQRVGCVTGEADHIKAENDSATAKGTRAYWGYETVIKHLEHRVGSVLVCVGPVFAIRRSLYAPLQADLANDLELPLRIGHEGYWIRYEPGARSVERATSSPFQEFRRQRRICAQGALASWRFRGLLTGLRGWQFVSRKSLRWLTWVPLLTILISSVALARSPLFRMLLVLQVVFYALGFLGGLLALLNRSGGPLLSVPFYLLLIGTAAVVGIIDVCAGRRFVVWEIATLSRGRVT